MTDADGADHPPTTTLIPNAQMSWRYLNQGVWWTPKGRPQIKIEEMDLAWRYNASRWMERRARLFEVFYSMGELEVMGARTMRSVVGEVDGVAHEGGDFFSHFDLMSENSMDAWESELDRRSADPLAWLRTTTLYRALVRDLPTDPTRLEELAQRAQHFSTCQIRNGQDGWCTCPPVAA